MDGNSNSGAATAYTNGHNSSAAFTDDAKGDGSDPSGVAAVGNADVPSTAQSNDPYSASSDASNGDSDSKGSFFTTTSFDDTPINASASVPTKSGSGAPSGTGDDGAPFPQ